MSEMNKASARRYIEAWNNGDAAALDAIVAADYVDHSALPGVPPGLEGEKQAMAVIRTAFPDTNAKVDDQITEGDKVVSRITWQGTQRGEFMGIPATNKSFKAEEIHVVRYEDGVAKEHWGEFDLLGLMQQLGVAPGP